MRKLKRNPAKLTQLKTEPIKKKILLKIKRKRCDFIHPDGNQCKALAAGKGNFCAFHSEGEIFREDKSLTPTNPGSCIARYDPINHPKQYMELSAHGLSPVEIAAHFGISLQTISNWRENHLLFDQACEIGKAAHEAWYIREGKSNLDNRFYQTPLFKFLTMNNGLGWSDKAENKSQVQGQFGVLLVPGQMSIDDWEKQNIENDKKLQERLHAEMIELQSDQQQ